MKKLIAILILSLLCYSAEARNLMVVGGGVPAVVSSSFCPGTGLLYCEDFEGTTECISGGTATCRYTYSAWVSGTTTWNYATSPAPLEGTKSMLDVGGLYRKSDIWTADEVYLTQRMVFIDETSASSIHSPRILKSSGALVCGAFFYWNPTENRWFFHLEGTGSATTGTQYAFHSTDHDTEAEALYIKLHYKKGTGSDSVCECWVSDDGTTWNNNVVLNETNWTDQSTGIAIGGYESGSQVIIDKIKVDNSDITDATQ